MNLDVSMISNDLLKKNTVWNGLTNEAFSYVINQYFKQQQENILIITPTLYEANQIYDSLVNYTDAVYLFPMDDFLTSEAVAISPDLKITRLDTINQILKQPKSIVITHLMGYLRFLPTPSCYKNHILQLNKNTSYQHDELLEKIYCLGYHRESMVTQTGEYAVRGYILDIFPLNVEHPIRIEFFDEEIESIRYFDESTQKSLEIVDSIVISPYTEYLLDEQNPIEILNQKYLKQNSKKIASLGDYLPNHLTVFKDEPRLIEQYRHLMEEVLTYKANNDLSYQGEYFHQLENLVEKDVIYYQTIDNLSQKKFSQINFNSKTINQFNENIDLLTKYLDNAINHQKTVILSLKPHQLQSIKKYVHMTNFNSIVNQIKENAINVTDFLFLEGFEMNSYIVLTAKEIFNQHIKKKVYQTKYKYSSKVKDVNKLQIGDYVVHYVHGIGVYNGIKTLESNHIKKDYLELLYYGTDKLYIPVEKIEYISKFSGKEGIVPKINKLGGNEWEKTKNRVRKRVKDIAEKLLKIYAARELQTGFKFSKDSEFQTKFEEEFPYSPTKDQLIAIQQIKEDMESSSPMDRLLCGDVGYGKTEVAFRAIFKAIMDSKQVIYLCPTTILSNQQYKNAKTRFANYPVRIALLNRFTTTKETKEILKQFHEGQIDLLFGTHRLLSSDVVPKDLGLLVIDEEQRFGVSHKEKIKEYKTNIDVLTLTATPIPRTLQLSLVGIRSMSLIETPPIDRYPVQTYVLEENDLIIKDAIYKELARNGQVFLLYNSVENIEQKANQIQNLVKEARINYAHGQMSKEELENTMLHFINHDFDVLICTTIIETGIDIPNVNTLIILSADHFGLSQLYQIRGRVGRSNKIAYAYLMYSKNKLLSDTAIKRLTAIKEFTELGSGFSIATRDLSIRGAGDILGSEQAGFIDTIGIDLYLKMINQEVEKLKNGQNNSEYDEIMDDSYQEEQVEERPLLNVTTHIDDEYVQDTDIKIEIHQLINKIDSYDTLLEIKNQLIDRFGKVTDDMDVYMHEEWFEKISRKLGVKKVVQTRNSVEMHFSEVSSSTINTEKLFVDAYKITNMFRFQYKDKHLIVILDIIKLEKHFVYYLVELLNMMNQSE